MTEKAGWKGKVEVDYDQTSTFEELANVQSCDFEPMRALLDGSAFGDEGEVRIGGRTDFTASAPFFHDFANESSHTGLLDAILNEETVDVRIYPDRDASFYFEATCLVSSASGSASGGSTQQTTAEFQNSDGNKWGYST
jgi:hypothetical protein